VQTATRAGRIPAQGRAQRREWRVRQRLLPAVQFDDRSGREAAIEAGRAEVRSAPKAVIQADLVGPFEADTRGREAHGGLG
jgi:hypothetical protein